MKLLMFSLTFYSVSTFTLHFHSGSDGEPHIFYESRHCISPHLIYYINFSVSDDQALYLPESYMPFDAQALRESEFKLLKNPKQQLQEMLLREKNGLGTPVYCYDIYNSPNIFAKFMVKNINDFKLEVMCDFEQFKNSKFSIYKSMQSAGNVTALAIKPYGAVIAFNSKLTNIDKLIQLKLEERFLLQPAVKKKSKIRMLYLEHSHEQIIDNLFIKLVSLPGSNYFGLTNYGQICLIYYNKYNQLAITPQNFEEKKFLALASDNNQTSRFVALSQDRELIYADMSSLKLYSINYDTHGKALPHSENQKPNFIKKAKKTYKIIKRFTPQEIDTTLMTKLWFDCDTICIYNGSADYNKGVLHLIEIPSPINGSIHDIIGYMKKYNIGNYQEKQ